MSALRFAISISIGLHLTSATAQTFKMTGHDLRKQFDEMALRQGGDSIKKCLPTAAQVTMCIFNTDQFEKSVNYFKKMNLANGSFQLNEVLSYKEDKGKIARVVLSGERSDPMNLFHFWGDVGSILQILDPGVNDDMAKKHMLELGMEVGDSDPHIGDPKSVIEENVAAECTAENSKISTDVRCVFDPRF